MGNVIEWEDYFKAEFKDCERREGENRLRNWFACKVEVVFSYQKEWDYVTCRKMEGNWDHTIKSHKGSHWSPLYVGCVFVGGGRKVMTGTLRQQCGWRMVAEVVEYECDQSTCACMGLWKRSLSFYAYGIFLFRMCKVVQMTPGHQERQVEEWIAYAMVDIRLEACEKEPQATECT